MKGATAEPTEPESVPIDLFLSMPLLGEEEAMVMFEDADMCMSVSQVDPAPKADPEYHSGKGGKSGGKGGKSGGKGGKSAMPLLPCDDRLFPCR